MHHDRLSAIIRHFHIAATTSANGGVPNFVVWQRADAERFVSLWPAGRPAGWRGGQVLAEAFVSLGGDGNPLIAALPEELCIALAGDGDAATLATLLAGELAEPRCGGASVLSRYCEILIVHMLRHAIATHDAAEPGLLAGLAHPGLSRAIVAMHQAPDRDWSVDDLVALAGMSRSVFMAEFRARMRQTPMRYLKEWRMTLARTELAAGTRIGEVARRFGYRSGDSFARAFRAIHGKPPSSARRWTGRGADRLTG